MSSSSPASSSANSSHSGKNEPEQTPRAPHDITLSRIANGNAGKIIVKTFYMLIFFFKGGDFYPTQAQWVKKGVDRRNLGF